MADIAQVQVQRLIHLIAWMSQRDNGEPVTYATAAAALDTTVKTLKSDLEVLLGLTGSHKDWLASLSVALGADSFSVRSLGAFRRPLRLSRDESLALVIGLMAARGGRELASKLGHTLGAGPDTSDVSRDWAIGPTLHEVQARALALARQARDAKRKLELGYCGSSGEPSRRVVHVHQVVRAGPVWYLVAWCEKSDGMRHFRLDRVLEMRLQDSTFTRRRGFRPIKDGKAVFSSDATLTATVAFSPAVTRWLKERYHGTIGPDGRFLVQLPVADPRWLAREVLQYGAEAEVLEPPALREFVRGLVG